MILCSGSTSKQRRARVIFSYHPQADDELELADGDEVIVLGVEEEGWWKGRIGGREGVFPSHFVEEITGDASEPYNDEKVCSVISLCVNVYTWASACI